MGILTTKTDDGNNRVYHVQPWAEHPLGVVTNIISTTGRFTAIELAASIIDALVARGYIKPETPTFTEKDESGEIK